VLFTTPKTPSIQSKALHMSRHRQNLSQLLLQGHVCDTDAIWVCDSVFLFVSAKVPNNVVCLTLASSMLLQTLHLSFKPFLRLQSVFSLPLGLSVGAVP
jgi:hypothetical protein